jgi:superfamily I DNA/RNA helicase
MDIDIIEKNSGIFTETIDLPVKLKPSQRGEIEKQYKNIIKSINEKSKKKYKSWKLYVQRQLEIKNKNIIPETYPIYVLDDSEKEIYLKDQEFSALAIKKLRKSLIVLFKESMNVIDNSVIKPLWKEWCKIFIEPFAIVDYAVSCSCHRSQGSTFYNVFIDIDDILNNNNSDESRRCLYTALTRASNEIHILLPK